MEKEKLKKGFYLIKADTKDYSLTEERKKESEHAARIKTAMRG